MKTRKQRLEAEWEGRTQINWWNVGGFMLAGAIALTGLIVVAFHVFFP